jgi:hypothetical protein
MADVTTTEYITRQAPEIEAYKLGLLESSKALANIPRQLPGYEAAALTPQQQQATQLGQAGIGAYQPFLQQAGQTLQQGIGQLAGVGQAPTQQGLAQYLNPYQQQVIDEINRQAEQKQIQARGSAVMSGAFGGGREAVLMGELERARLGQVGLAQQSGYESALKAFQNQQQQQIQAAQGLGSLGSMQAGLGASTQQLGITDINTLLGLGSIQQQQAQKEIEARRATQLQAAQEPYGRLGFLSDIYAGAPTAQQTSQQTIAPSTSPLLQAAGLGIAGIGALGTAKQAGLF